MEHLISETELAAFQAFLLGSDVKVTEVSIAYAAVRTLNTVPTELVAAPPAGYINEFISAVLILDWLAGPYSANGTIGVYETDASGNPVSTTVALSNFLGKSEDWVVVLQALSANTVVLPDVALVLADAAGDSITGTSPVRVKITYRCHETGL